MALLTAPCFCSPHSSLLINAPATTTHSLLRTPPRFRRHLSLSLSFIAKAKFDDAGNSGDGAAILWFKQDLRVDDHPGLVAASKHPMIVPLYVFDPRIVSRFSDEMVELLLLALEDLRRELRELGSNLMIRFGQVEDVMRELVKETRATKIFAEEEVEYDLRSLIDIIEEALAADVLGSKAKLALWHTPFYDIEDLDGLPLFYEDLKKPQINGVSLLIPQQFPSNNIGMNWGELPSKDDVGKFMDYHCQSNKEKEKWYSIKGISAEDIFKKDHLNLVGSYRPLVGELSVSDVGTKNQNRDQTKTKRLKNSVFGTTKGNIVAGGGKVVLNALAAYLKYLEGTAKDDWQEVHLKLRETEIRNGASFGVLFGSVLQLGIISRRRVYYEALKYEKERNAGFLSPFGYSTVTVAAAINTVCSLEWYWLLSLKSQLKKEESYPSRIWRWNGHLIQYTVVDNDGPSVLLVHGFGAFYEHYRRNLCDIAEAGNRVWAVTLLGFGKSEKPNIVYTELMWAELLRDFIIEVVGEPVHLVGNSMGGYFISIVGGVWTSLVKSIVLMNSAGEVIPGFSSLLFSKEREISGAAWLGARALLQYLRISLGGLVKKCYPTRSERADDWLINEMLRASYDPGSIEVLESVFSFNLSIPLNHLFTRLKDRILIIQGMKDPIVKSSSKLAMIREHCNGIIIKELDAGHCPHDELPEIVNPVICEWIEGIEKKVCAENFDSVLGSSCS